MGKRKYVVGMECRNLLDKAVEKRLFVKITNKDNNRWEMYKSRFVAVEGNRIALAQPIPEPDQPPMEAACGQTIAVSFKKGYNKCLLIARIVGHGEHEFDDGVSAPTVLILRPEYVEKLQRRAFNRADAPPGDPIEVTFQSVDNDSPKWQGVLSNLSAGGLAVTVPHSEVPDLADDEQFTISLVPLRDQEALQLHGRYRHASPTIIGGKALLGFQFMGLDISEEGRGALRRIGRIVSVYQRHKPISRHRELVKKR